MSMPTFAQRTEYLRQKKLEYTQEKQQVIGYMDYDDWGMVLPSQELRKTVQAMSGSGVLINDVILKDFQTKPNHPNGGFYGFKGVSENFHRLLCIHPPFIDPMSGLAGAYMTNFSSYLSGANPDLDHSHLDAMVEKYKLNPSLLTSQHFCQENSLVLDLGWDGMLEKMNVYRNNHGPEKKEFYDAEALVIDGIQQWITHNAEEALRMSKMETDPEIAAHLRHLADMNFKLVHEKPETFEEACQFLLWYQMTCRMYNGSGSCGRLDNMLLPYYEKDLAEGRIDREQAQFLIACLLLRDTCYVHVGSYDTDGNDTTNELSFLILEAVHALGMPSNVGVGVGKGISRDLLRRAVEIQFEGKKGNPRFLGVDSLIEGFVKNPGVTLEHARLRSNSGCHWLAVPGLEYAIMDGPKINLAAIFDVALRESVEHYGEPTMEQLLTSFAEHMKVAVDTMAMGYDFTYDNQIYNLPELALNLACYHTLERGLDASNGGMDLYTWCLDGAGNAIVADSLAAIEQRILKEKRYTYQQLIQFLDSDWSGPEGEKARMYFQTVERYGKGGTAADEYGIMISRIFTDTVTSTRTPKYGHPIVPGLFSWANTIAMGKDVAATPNGRKAGTPINHGANPNPGFREDGAATAMSHAIASIQPGYGNTAPMQLELEPSVTHEEGGVELIMALIEDHFAQGGTLINLNVIDADKVREAHKDPSKYPDLVVRVTGFSAYFASLSPEFRQLVVDRILDRTIS